MQENVLTYNDGDPGTISCLSIGGEPRPTLSVFIGTTDYTAVMTATYSQRNVEVGGIPTARHVVRLTRSNIPGAELSGYNGTTVRCDATTIVNVTKSVSSKISIESKLVP